jgi:hypothetical protein
MALVKFHFYNLLYARKSWINLLFTCLPSESYWLSHFNILSSQIHFSATIPKAHNSAQVNAIFFIWVRCALMFLGNETETTLQLHSSWWPVIVSTGFEEVYFYHSITTYQAGQEGQCPNKIHTNHLLNASQKHWSLRQLALLGAIIMLISWCHLRGMLYLHNVSLFFQIR